MNKNPANIDPINGLFVTKLTNDVMDTIVEAIEGQAAPETAAALASISVKTFRNWLRIGRQWLDAEGRDEDEVPVPEAIFTVRVERAMERAKQDLVDGIVAAKDWRGNLELLQRRHPREFGKRERIDVGHPEDEMWELATKDLSFLPLDDLHHLQRIFRAIAEHRQGGADVIDMTRRRELER